VQVETLLHLRTDRFVDARRACRPDNSATVLDAIAEFLNVVARLGAPEGAIEFVVLTNR